MENTNKEIIIKKKKKCDGESLKCNKEIYKNTEQQMLAEQKDKPLAIETVKDVVEPVKTLIIREDKNIPVINDVLANIPKNTNDFLRKKKQIVNIHFYILH
jgi:hypothetical protein